MRRRTGRVYTTINHANLILKYVPGIGFTDEGEEPDQGRPLRARVLLLPLDRPYLVTLRY